jgi:uncharacterized protein (UPF0335 family)
MKPRKSKKKKEKTNKSRKDESSDPGGDSSANEDEGHSEPPMHIRLTVCKEVEDTSGAMLACFSDAPPPRSLHSEGVRFECGFEEEDSTRYLKGESKSLLFEGLDSADAGVTYKYMVGLYDPEKGEMVIVDPGEERSGNVVQLERMVKSTLSGGQLGDMSREQAREALVEGFGSKRVKSVHKLRKGQALEKEGGDTVLQLGSELQAKKEETDAGKVRIAFPPFFFSFLRSTCFCIGCFRRTHMAGCS